MRAGGTRGWGVALAGVVLLAWGVRVLPFWRLGTLGYALDYDEGVYFSAAALLWHGVLPYRDFVFVHPPGALWLEGLAAAMTSQVGVDTGLQAARWLAAAVGALNVLAVGRLAGRTWGGVAGVFAALAYASHPEAVGLERGPFLEPWLNLACLGLANAWLVRPAPGMSGLPGTKGRAWAWAGVFAGLALSVKVLGGLWLAAALLSPPSRAPGSASSSASNSTPAPAPGPVWREGAGLVLVAGATVLVLVGPLFLAAPTDFLQQVFGFHARRPPDGIFGLERLHEIFHERRWGTMLLALGGWGLAVGRAFRADSGTRAAERFFAATYALTVAAFLASPSYWSQYNAYLAASECVLAGLAAGALAGALSRGAGGGAGRGWRWGARVLGVGVVVLGSLPALGRGARQRLSAQRTLAAEVRARVPADAPLCAFEPAWALAAGRLPAWLPAAPRMVVDPYALMLRDALSSGGPFADTGQALGTPAAQRDVRRWLAQCRFVVLGGRGAWQLSAESHQWFESRFTRRFLDEAAPGLDLWERDGPAP